MTIPVRYNHEDRELTLEEATRYAQLGLQQDAQLQRLNRLAADNDKTLQQLIGDLEQSYREQVYAGLLEECGGNEAVARRLLDAEMKEKDAAYATRQQEAAKSAEDAKAARQEKLAGELQELMDEFPERDKSRAGCAAERIRRCAEKRAQPAGCVPALRPRRGQKGERRQGGSGQCC